ncbi:MAG TPA: pectate lyase [Planctomycetaceae bacterium]
MRPLFLSLILLAPVAVSASWKEVRNKPAEWFQGDEAKAAAANVLSWQTENGDWPKNVETFAETFPGGEKPEGTFDNGATVGEIRFLARMFGATGRDEYRDAALKGIDHVINAQYISGGFPQKSPPGEKYPRYVTFNDGTTVNLLRLMREVSEDETFAFAGEGRRRVAGRMVQAGVRCILTCQHQGRFGVTVWAAQYDENTLQPRPARSFEPASLAAAESADVLLFLMSFENPSPDVVFAIEAGVSWFRKAALRGVRVVETDEDVTVVRDPDAPPVWARFYDFDTMRPIFAGRDGVVKHSLAEIEQERRTGYAWYGDWGLKVFREYPKWRERVRPKGDPPVGPESSPPADQ